MKNKLSYLASILLFSCAGCTSIASGIHSVNKELSGYINRVQEPSGKYIDVGGACEKMKGAERSYESAIQGHLNSPPNPAALMALSYLQQLAPLCERNIRRSAQISEGDKIQYANTTKKVLKKIKCQIANGSQNVENFEFLCGN